MQQSNMTKLLICTAGLYTTATTLLCDIRNSDFEGYLAISVFNSSCKRLGWVSMTTEPVQRTCCPAMPSRDFTCRVTKMQFSYMKGLLQFKTSACYPVLQYSFNRLAVFTSEQHPSRINICCCSVFCLKKKKLQLIGFPVFPFLAISC